MPKLRVIVIEDEFFAAQHLSDLIGQLGFLVVGTYHSGEEFLQSTKWDFDAAVVDIFLSDQLSGLDLAEHMNEQRKPFIFLTANQDSRTLKEAARVNPTAYISKPFKPNDVAAALEKISYQQPDMLEVRGASGVEYINPNDIQLIRSDGAYVEIETTKGMVVQRKLLKEIIDVLPDYFVRVHRSYLVNTNYIEKRSASLLVVGGKEVPISRSYKENLASIL